MGTNMYITFSALSTTELLHHHLKFVYIIPFSYQPIQHGPSAPEQKPSTVLQVYRTPASILHLNILEN